MSKRSDAVAIMSANADKSMAEVVTLIADAINVTEGNAKSYYRYIVEHKLAPGTVTKSSRKLTDAKVEKQVKRESKTAKAQYENTVRSLNAKAKTKAAAVAALTGGRIKASKEVPATSLLPDSEVARIKEANLKRMREVTAKRKVYTNVARPEGDGVADFDADVARAEVAAIVDDFDNFKAPRFLSKSELKAVL
jgi:hypothetical protein